MKQKTRKLTQKQTKFKENILKGDNGTQAAIKAGYAIKSARVVAHNNITNSNIMSEINRRNKELEKKTNWDVEKLVKKHENIIEQAEDKGDLSTATANVIAIGKTFAAYTDNINNSQVQPVSELTAEDKAELKRLAMLSTGIKLVS